MDDFTGFHYWTVWSEDLWAHICGQVEHGNLWICPDAVYGSGVFGDGFGAMLQDYKINPFSERQWDYPGHICFRHK